jgi:hypothetical protein
MNAASPAATDLFFLVSDQNMLAAVRGLMTRRKSLQIDETFTFEIRPHPEHDPGCFLRSHDFLKPFQVQYRFALVIFDREGCGSDDSRESLESAVESRLSASGWQNRSAAVAIDPELENWVWSESPHVAESLGWQGKPQDLRVWLESHGELAASQSKPARPKESMQRVLRHTRQPRSSTVYERLARKVGLSSCRDPAFGKMRTLLQLWFPQ